MTSVLKRYHESTARLEALIEGNPPSDDASAEAVRARATMRMERLRAFLATLDHPERGYPIVHVGGTSGKGSTSATIASILTQAGYRTGLHTSPYLQTPTEKLQLGRKLVSPDAYSNLVDAVLEAHERWTHQGGHILTYGELWMALTMLFFQTNQVDIAVLEVGAGGRFDLTNIVSPTLSVITSVGIDHTRTLGETIGEIAWHKAGIIKPGVPVVTAVTNAEALSVITREARDHDAPLTVLTPERNILEQRTTTDMTTWRDAQLERSLAIGLRGRFQAVNGATAVHSVRALADRGFPVRDAQLEEGLRKARIPGRAEFVADTVPILLDGAHNADKIAAFVGDVPQLLPRYSGSQRIVVMGVLEAKSATEMVANVATVADVLIATSPRVLAKPSRGADEFADIARSAGFGGRVEAVALPTDAVTRAVELARPGHGDQILVTGSLYLIGNVRERWYRHDDIVLQRTPWPGSGDSFPAQGGPGA